MRSQDHPPGAGGIGKDRRAGHDPCPKKGGGRKKLIEISADLEANFLKVLEDHTAGDPMRAEVKWTNLSRGQISRRLGDLGTPASRHLSMDPNCYEVSEPELLRDLRLSG